MSENNNLIVIEPENIKDVTETTVVESTQEDFVNSDNVEGFKLLSLKSKVNDITAIMDDISSKQKALLNDDDIEFAKVDEVINSLTEEEINKLSSEELEKILVDDDGNAIEFNIDFGNDKDTFVKFEKEFLILRKKSNEAIKVFDDELQKINAEIAESQEDFDKLVSEFGNVSNLIRANLNKRLENAKNDEQRKLIETLITAFDNGLYLNNLKDYCRSYKGRTIITDFRSDKNSNYIYRRYLRVIKTLNIETDLTSFNNLESRYLSEEYQKRTNIFVFAMIHFISSWHNKAYTKADGLFITQFTVNLKNLFYNKFDTEEDREIFISAIKEVIKIIG